MSGVELSAGGRALAEQDTRTLVREIYDAYARGDFERVATMIDNDVDWVIYGPVEVFPFAGPRRGKADVLQVLASIAEQYKLESYNPELMIVDGDRAAVMSDVSFIQRATDRKLRFRVANFLRFRNGRVIEFREFANTFDVAEQALGRWLTV